MTVKELRKLIKEELVHSDADEIRNFLSNSASLLNKNKRNELFAFMKKAHEKDHGEERILIHIEVEVKSQSLGIKKFDLT